MKKPAYLFVFSVVLAASLNLGMARHGQYDEEARLQEKQQKEMEKKELHPVKAVASGVKQATYDSAAGLVKDTAAGTTEEAPVIGTLEGVRRGAGKALDSSIKGVAKVATLGMADTEHYVVEEPEHGSDEPTKVKFSF